MISHISVVEDDPALDSFMASDEEDQSVGKVTQSCPICSRTFKYSSAFRKHIK